ncbi:MAG: methylenetetrahydrofolate reductase [Deltaproteobacteria bacterium]|nr:methylenetetrahydrofolate reductase [Deltaproteobacteria bacterium]
MRISDRLKRSAPTFSFEFFPPKTDEGVTALFATLRELAALSPDFVSVTYGAGGSNRDRTLDLVARIKADAGLEAMAHLTCVGHTRAEIAAILNRLAVAGIENILALRGDAPAGDSNAKAPSRKEAATDPSPLGVSAALRQIPAPDDFAHASDLATFIREQTPPPGFCIGGACYPEGHLESATRDDDLTHTKLKVASGAEFLITQLFFDNAFYFHFVDRARAAGITCPIIPGIMPITNFEQIERFTRLCGATIPMRLRLALERAKDDADAILELGVAHAAVQCKDLLSRGAPGIHFYTLNRSRATRMIFTALNV